jgi:hypothetical protein
MCGVRQPRPAAAYAPRRNIGVASDGEEEERPQQPGLPPRLAGLAPEQRAPFLAREREDERERAANTRRAEQRFDELDRQFERERLARLKQEGEQGESWPLGIGNIGRPTPGQRGYVAPQCPQYDWEAHERDVQGQQQACGKVSEEVFFDLIDPSGSPAGLG